MTEAIVEAAEEIVSRKAWSYVFLAAYIAFLAGWAFGRALGASSAKRHIISALEKL